MQNTEKPLQIQAFFLPCLSQNVPDQPNKLLHLLIICFALGRIGNNLNQISRYFHQHGATTPGIEKDISACISKIYDMSARLDEIEGAADGDTETHCQ